MPPSLPTKPLERTYYYQGELLQLVDFIREQQYFRDLCYYQNNQLFAPGVLQGLALSGVGATQAIVAPGMAFSGKGIPLYVVRATTMSGQTQPQDGLWLAVLDYSYTTLQSAHTITEDPKLSLVENGTPVTEGGIILGTVEYKSGKISSIDQTATGGRQTSYLLLPTTPPTPMLAAKAEGAPSSDQAAGASTAEELVPVLLQSVRELTTRVAELEKRLLDRDAGR